MHRVPRDRSTDTGQITSPTRTHRCCLCSLGRDVVDGLHGSGQQLRTITLADTTFGSTRWTRGALPVQADAMRAHGQGGRIVSPSSAEIHGL